MAQRIEIDTLVSYTQQNGERLELCRTTHNGESPIWEILGSGAKGLHHSPVYKNYGEA